MTKRQLYKAWLLSTIFTLKVQTSFWWKVSTGYIKISLLKYFLKWILHPFIKKSMLIKKRDLILITLINLKNTGRNFARIFLLGAELSSKKFQMEQKMFANKICSKYISNWTKNVYKENLFQCEQFGLFMDFSRGHGMDQKSCF